MEHLRQVMTSPSYQLAFQEGFAKDRLVGWPLKAIDFCPYCGSNSVEPFEPIQLPASQPGLAPRHSGLNECVARY